MRIWHFRAIRLVEALHEGMLCRLAQLNEVERDAVLLRPVLQVREQELGAVVQAQGCRRAGQREQVRQRAQGAAASEKPSSIAKPSRVLWSSRFRFGTHPPCRACRA